MFEMFQTVDFEVNFFKPLFFQKVYFFKSLFFQTSIFFSKVYFFQKSIFFERLKIDFEIIVSLEHLEALTFSAGNILLNVYCDFSFLL